MGGPPPGGGPLPGGPQQPVAQATQTPIAQATATPTPTPSYTTLYKAVKTTQLVCQKGTTKKTVTATACPTGYKKISSKSVTTYIETKVLVNP